jgi:hypothetical protein
MKDAPMADDTNKIRPNRQSVVADDTYEIAEFARKFGISPGEAKTIIKRYGPSRKKLDAHMAARNA